VPGDGDLMNVKDVAGFGALHENPVEKPGERKERRRGRREHEQRRPADYFVTMEKAALRSNEILVSKKLPYRFSVHKTGDEVFIELVVLDEKGKITKKVRRNITEESFARWIEDITRSEGLFFDSTA
jgi:hypothetical protein